MKVYIYVWLCMCACMCAGVVNRTDWVNVVNVNVDVAPGPYQLGPAPGPASCPPCASPGWFTTAATAWTWVCMIVGVPAGVWKVWKKRECMKRVLSCVCVGERGERGERDEESEESRKWGEE